jgi:hypothetical protein
MTGFLKFKKGEGFLRFNLIELNSWNFVFFTKDPRAFIIKNSS